MQHLNDDMDELFRRAAEDYPLNTRGADWQKMQALLAQQPPSAPAPQKGRKRQFLWLLLLLPLALICSRVQENIDPVPAKQKANNSVAPVPAHRAETAEGHATKTTDMKRVPSPGTANSPGGDDHTVLSPAVSPAVAEKQSENRPSSDRQPASRQTERAAVAQNSAAAAGGDTPGKLDPLRMEPIVTMDALGAFDREPLPARLQDERIDLSRARMNLTAATPAALRADSNANEPSSKRRRFYVGVVGGPDLSTVRFERFSAVGFTAGIVLGYRLSRRFSVEAGALSSKKYYYSEGEYLNTKKLYLPANTEVLRVEGNCRMVELPLSLHYSFRSTDRHSWFASLGLSSYLMKKEDYTYDYLYRTSGTVVAHQKTYENQTKNWLSVLQLSVGYTSKLEGIGELRLEPYYALPLRGIGYGELPLSSVGLRLAITSKQF